MILTGDTIISTIMSRISAHGRLNITFLARMGTYPRYKLHTFVYYKLLLKCGMWALARYTTVLSFL